jgi:hypothetical protein
MTPSCIVGIPFTAVFDHLALVYLIAAPVIPGNRKLMTMILNLQEFNFEIEDRKGGQHADAELCHDYCDCDWKTSVLKSCGHQATIFKK